MNGIQATVRRALGRARRLPAHTSRAGRALLALGTAATLIATALGAPLPAQADEPSIRAQINGAPPVARVQVVLKSVHIFDNHALIGDGDMDLQLRLLCYATPTPCQDSSPTILDIYDRRFSAGDGEVLTFDQVLPVAERWNPDYDASVNGGYPLRHGQSYQLTFNMQKENFFQTPDDLGDREIMLTEANDWGTRGGDTGHGDYSLRSVDGGKFGDFVIEFDVRKIPLPDIQPINITVQNAPFAGKSRVCMTVENIGDADAGPFELLLLIDDIVAPDGATTVGGVLRGAGSERCVDTYLPTAGQHTLKAFVDLPNTLLEYNEANNVFEQTYKATGPASPASPSPSADLPDLTVSAIKVNGQVPDGKDDCTAGKNDVTVVVKNQGPKNASDFVTRLVVDDQGTTLEQSAGDGLEAGKELPLTFRGVQLKKGQHTLAATADATSGIGESDEDNNALNVAARCSGD